MQTLTEKIKTQKGLILKEMSDHPNRWFLCSDFCGGDPNCSFVGYKAPTRISELQKAGFLKSRWSERKTALGSQLKEYKLIDCDVYVTEKTITLEKIFKQDSLF